MLATQRLSETDIEVDRAKATHTRRGWERDAARDAVVSVISDYFDFKGEFAFDDCGDIEGVKGRIADLEGVTITVSIHDLVATATLTPLTD